MKDLDLQPVADDVDLDAYARLFCCDREMLDLARRCPFCSKPVLVCDNGVWLDIKPDDHGEMGVVNMGGLFMAAGGAIDGGSKHRIHEHQPDDS